MTSTHPAGPAGAHPSHVRPPQRWRLLGLAAVALGLTVAAPSVAGAATPPIRCWIPQPYGQTPVDTHHPDRVRFRQWDHRWEYAVDTDQGSAPFCVQVLPRVWVYVDDIKPVQAYLKALLSQTAPVGTGTDGISVTA